MEEEEETKKKEMLREIIREADEYKVQLYKRRKIACETNEATGREKEKDMFNAEAEKNYWRAIMELISNEVPATEKGRRSDNEKKPSVIVIQGPKPGKPTEISRSIIHLLTTTSTVRQEAKTAHAEQDEDLASVLERSRSLIGLASTSSHGKFLIKEEICSRVLDLTH